MYICRRLNCIPRGRFNLLSCKLYWNFVQVVGCWHTLSMFDCRTTQWTRNSNLDCDPCILLGPRALFSRLFLKICIFVVSLYTTGRLVTLPYYGRPPASWPTAIIQEAQLPQRDSASATHVFLGSLTDRALHWAPHLFLQLHNRLAKLVSTLSANKPCDIRTLSWIGHSRSFKVILICAGRNPERCVVVMRH